LLIPVLPHQSGYRSCLKEIEDCSPERSFHILWCSKQAFDFPGQLENFQDFLRGKRRPFLKRFMYAFEFCTSF